MQIRRPFGINLLHNDGNFDFYDPGSRRGWSEQALSQHHLVELLSACNDWKERTELSNFLIESEGVDEEAAENAIDYLLESGLLVNDEDVDHAYLDGKDRQFYSKYWNEALLFHWHTNRYPKLDYFNDPRDEQDQAMMRKYLAIEPPPPNYKDYMGKLEIPLEKSVKITQRPLNEIMGDVPYDTSTEDCASIRSLEGLSWFLYLAFGQTYVRNMQMTGKHVAKTSPSGGSRHPTEVYAIVLSNDNLEHGLYHYSVRNHSLVLLLPGEHKEFVRENVFILGDRPNFKPSIVFLYSSIFERSMYRYRESRSYRVVNFDIGHLMQTVSYLAKAIGAHSYGGYSHKDSIVDKFLGIDGVLESSMAYTALG